ncbi:hypothetical protein NEISUBOT_05546 [Neisseria subflava NJ9703]|uniref:Uncharacterized protein n=1 Tax=Neisseria subflava NJ9703 TaxID=546268 RepID=A0A9W5INZ6_NEISU|nr:hypothetical protein NEISUBOT_05546 [Neisseria subflava NJ9703]
MNVKIHGIFTIESKGRLKIPVFRRPFSLYNSHLNFYIHSE